MLLHQLSKILSEKDLERVTDSIKTIILCDRYRKKEAVSKGLNFSVLRNVLHKYNTKNLGEFMKDASYSLIYSNFYLKYGQTACQEQQDVCPQKFMKRMIYLREHAIRYLPEAVNSILNQNNCDNFLPHTHTAFF